MMKEHYTVTYKCGCTCGHRHKTRAAAEQCEKKTAARHHDMHAEIVARNAGRAWGVRRFVDGIQAAY